MCINLPDRKTDYYSCWNSGDNALGYAGLETEKSNSNYKGQHTGNNLSLELAVQGGYGNVSPPHE